MYVYMHIYTYVHMREWYNNVCVQGVGTHIYAQNRYVRRLKNILFTLTRN